MFTKEIISIKLDKSRNRISGQDGGIGKHNLPLRTAAAKITTGLQNSHCPESSEN